MNLVALWTHLQARLRRDDRGASLVEYVLLVALIAVVCIVALQLLGNSASDKLTSVCASRARFWFRKTLLFFTGSVRVIACRSRARAGLWICR